MSKLISWKNPFERLNEEYELTQKKKEALDKLHDDGKISQSTYDSFNKKIDEAIAEIERQQRALLEKMNSKAGELEKHVKTLETLLADFEIRHVTGEIEEEVYQREIDLLSIGLETARQELDGVKEAIDELSSGIPIQPTEIDTPEETATQTMESQTPEDIENIESAAEVVDEIPQVVEIEKIPDEIEQPTLPEPPEDAAEDDIEETISQSQESEEETEMESQDTQEETEETWQDTEEDEETTQSMEEEALSEEEDEETTQSVDEEIQQTW